MTSQNIEKDGRKDSEASLPISTSTASGAPSMREFRRPSSDDDDEPDWPRSWRAYTCLVGCFFLMFNSWGLVNAYGTWSSYYVGHSLRNVNQLELNLIGSSQCFLVLLLSNPVGRLLDAGHFRKVIGFGTVFVPLGLFILSVVHPSNVEAVVSFGPIWATQGLVVGLGMAPFFVSSSQVAATWFPKRRGLAVGYVACGASVAGVIYPTMLRYLIDAVGFNNAVRYVATLTSVTCIFSFIFATPNPVHEFHKPENWFEVRTWFDTDAFRNKAWCWFTASVSFMFFGFYPIFFNLEEWAAVRGFGTRNSSGANQTVPQSVDDQPLQTFWLLTIMNGASTVGRLALALFSDKIGPLNMHIASQLICSLLTLVLWSLASSETDAIAFCVVFGIFSGMVIGLPPASVANILSCTYTTPETIALAKKKLGHWVGMMYSCAAVPALLGPVISGHLITKYDTYITVQMWSGTNLFLSFVCMMMARWNLACADGQSFEHHLSRKSASTKEKLRLGSDATAAGLVSPTALSQAPTQVPSVTNSRERLEQPNQPSERMV